MQQRRPRVRGRRVGEQRSSHFPVLSAEERGAAGVHQQDLLPVIPRSGGQGFGDLTVKGGNVQRQSVIPAGGALLQQGKVRPACPVQTDQRLRRGLRRDLRGKVKLGQGGGIGGPVLHGQGGGKPLELGREGTLQGQRGLTGVVPVPGSADLGRLCGGGEKIQRLVQRGGDGPVHCVAGVQKPLVRALEDRLLVPANGLLSHGRAGQHQQENQCGGENGPSFCMHARSLPLSSGC